VTELLTARSADHPFDPDERLRELAPVSRLTFPDGHEGWVVTSHALVREVLSDRRFSARNELRHNPMPGAGQSSEPSPPGMFTSMDAPEHTRYRRLLTGQFTVRRMRQLSEQVHAITTEHLDAMTEQGSPADLVEALAQPIPAQVICELLGVPYADRARFQADALNLFRLGLPPSELAAAYGAVQAFVQELVLAKRAKPTDDLLSGLTESDLTDEELVNIGFSLLGAGLDTTANMIALSAYALLCQPSQLDALRADPGHAVEELLRYLSIIPATVRAALEDVELGGRLIRAGESVAISVPAANRDPAAFADPDTLDLRRQTSRHVAFGHGIHQCLGQQLARVELQVALPALFERFPTLRLAVSPEEVPLRTDMIIYGVHKLPVAWNR
jgi:cytochrome P450